MARFMLSGGKMTQEGYRNITEHHMGKEVPFLHFALIIFLLQS